MSADHDHPRTPRRATSEIVLGATRSLGSFTRSFWVANTLELFERFARQRLSRLRPLRTVRDRRCMDHHPGYHSGGGAVQAIATAHGNDAGG